MLAVFLLLTRHPKYTLYGKMEKRHDCRRIFVLAYDGTKLYANKSVNGRNGETNLFSKDDSLGGKGAML